MTSTMSFQYPPPSVGGSDMDMQQAPYLPVYSIPSQQQQQQQQQAGTGMANPRTSQVSMHDPRDPSLGLRRSFSTPNAVPFSGAGLDQSQGGLPGEKKRNKLGYHRSSVACVHCRKRKIRCVTDPADKQGRCTNCMRLKKECSFHPVDQPNSLETRAKSSVRGANTQRNPSASASPATSSGQPSETPAKRPISRQFFPPGVGPSALSSQEDDDHASVSDTASNGRLAGQSFELSSQPVNWASADMSHPAHGKISDFPGQWQPGAVIGDQFSYNGLSTSPGWQSETHGQPTHDGYPWSGMPAPVRSMSYSGDALPGHHQGQFDAAAQGMIYDRRASNFTGVYNPALGGPLPDVEHGGQQIVEGTRPFPHGTASQDTVLWDTQAGQAPVQGSFQRPEEYEGWAYGHNANGH